MNAVIVHQNIDVINLFEEEISKVFGVVPRHFFRPSVLALDYIKKNKVDLIFVEVENDYIVNIDFCLRIKKYNFDIKVIYISDVLLYETYYKKLDRNYYKTIFYPFHNLEKSLLEIREKVSKKKEIRIECYNEFNVYIDNEIVLFPTPKVKEFLALIVDNHEKEVSVSTLAHYMFPNQELIVSKKLCQELITKLKYTLFDYEISSLLEVKRGKLCLNKKDVICRYFETQIRDENYMKDYSWSTSHY